MHCLVYGRRPIIVSALTPVQGPQQPVRSTDAEQIRQIIEISTGKGNWPIVPLDKLSVLASRSLLHPAIDDALKHGVTLGSKIRLSGKYVEPSNGTVKEKVIVADLKYIRYGRVVDCYQLELENVKIERWEGMEDFSGGLTIQLDKNFNDVCIGRCISFSSLF